MSTLATVVVVVVIVGLVVAAGLVLRSRTPSPWPALGLSALTCAVCFTVGGATGERATGPDVTVVKAAAAGLLTVVGAILALVPKRHNHPSPGRLSIGLGLLGVALGVVGLLFAVL